MPLLVLEKQILSPSDTTPTTRVSANSVVGEAHLQCLAQHQQRRN